MSSLALFAADFKQNNSINHSTTRKKTCLSKKLHGIMNEINETSVDDSQNNLSNILPDNNNDIEYADYESLQNDNAFIENPILNEKNNKKQLKNEETKNKVSKNNEPYFSLKSDIFDQQTSSESNPHDNYNESMQNSYNLQTDPITYNNLYNNSNSNDILIQKINHVITLLESEKDEKTNNITEELILYLFLGIFIIYVIDSFVKVGKYVR